MGSMTEAPKYEIYKDDETGLYVAEHPNLPVSSCGDTERDALENAQEAVQLYDEPEGEATPDFNLDRVTDAEDVQELIREDDVLDSGAEVMFPDFCFKHPDGRRVLFEIVGFWTPESLDKKLAKIREADRGNLIVAVSGRLDCSSENFKGMDDRVPWFKSCIHVYDVVELAEEYDIEVSPPQ